MRSDARSDALQASASHSTRPKWVENCQDIGDVPELLMALIASHAVSNFAKRNVEGKGATRYLAVTSCDCEG